jgi:DNA modification methylase
MPLFQTGRLNVSRKLLKDRYIVPPFSILNTITQNWQKRKDIWESMGFDSVQGSDVKRNNANPVNTFSARGDKAKEAERTSTFDPLLCEIMYKWFSNEGDYILDPFAGGSVRGIVAISLGRNYKGIDLSKEQVETNVHQYLDVASRYNIQNIPYWVCADSEDYLRKEVYSTMCYDMVFTCPPYYNLEKYTNSEDDLSNMPTYKDFIKKYAQILRYTSMMLANERFFVIVVSEIRNPETGAYYGFVPDTIKILKECGLEYYNDIILYNNLGSLPIRAPKYFDQSRKIGRTHQNILVFYKGNPKTIHSRYGDFFTPD